MATGTEQEMGPRGRRWQRLAGLSAFVVVMTIIVVGLITTLSRTDDSAHTAPRDGNPPTRINHDTSAASKADAGISPLLTGTGVLHIEGVRLLESDNGEVTGGYETEFWYDRSNGDARFEIKGTSGQQWYNFIHLRQGQMFTYYNVYTGAKRTATETAADTFAGPKPVEAMFRLEPAVIPDWDFLEPAGDEIVGGKKVTKLVAKANKKPILYIDKETRLPLKRVDLSWSSKDYQKQIHGAQILNYPVIENIKRDTLSDDYFSPSSLDEGPTPVPQVEPTLTMPTPSPPPSEPGIPFEETSAAER